MFSVFRKKKGGKARVKKKKSRAYVLNFIAFVCFTAALALIVLLRLFQVDRVVEWYNKYTDTLTNFENWIQANGATWLTVGIILANYTLKAVIPWFPLSCICVATGVIFKWYYATIINILGLSILFTIKFFWGKRYGGGNAEKIISKYDGIYKIIGDHKLGSAVILFALRLIPASPINSVSQLYGTTDINFWKYLAVSLAGFSYKLFSYTTIGRNVFDPLSAKFIVPFVLLLIFSGVIVLSLNGIISLVSINKNKYENNDAIGD